MHTEGALVTELQASGEMTARAPHAFCYCVELAAFEGEEREDAIGLAKLSPANDDTARLIGAWLRRSSPLRTGA